MNTTTQNHMVAAAKYPKGRYGVTRSKKAELDRLTDEVIDAEFRVEQDQATVDALTEKLVKFEGYFATADANRTISLNNVNTMKNVVQNALELREVSNSSLMEMTTANASMKNLAVGVKTVVEELIYTSESINKMSNLIVRKKAKNPLISDELMTVLGTAGTDANNAVALMLTAMKSAFTAQASSMESDAAAALEFSQSVVLYEVLTGLNYDGTPAEDYDNSLEVLLNNAYTNSKKDYDNYKNAVEVTKNQLNEAKFNLSKAEVKLTSLQSALAAANAAALAS